MSSIHFKIFELNVRKSMEERGRYKRVRGRDVMGLSGARYDEKETEREIERYRDIYIYIYI